MPILDLSSVVSVRWSGKVKITMVDGEIGEVAWTVCYSKFSVLQTSVIANSSFYEPFISFYFIPAGKIAEQAVWRSVFLTIWHRMLNADSTKTPSFSFTFYLLFINYWTIFYNGVDINSLRFNFNCLRRSFNSLRYFLIEWPPCVKGIMMTSPIFNQTLVLLKKQFK